MSKRTFKGTVVSTKMQKTIIVSVEMSKEHKKYGKKYIVHRKFKVHCDKKDVSEGDMVTIIEASPISKTKHWTIEKVHKVENVKK